LKPLQALEYIELSDAEHLAIGDLSQFGELGGLKSLQAYGLLDDGRPLDLSRCTGLETLSVNLAGNKELHDQDLLQLANMKHLWSLNLAPAAFTDEGLKTLSGLTELTVLDISGWNNRGDSHQITDAGLAHLANLKNLKQLSIRGTFKGSGFQHLKGLRSLGSLEVYSSQDVDAKAIQDLKRAMPWVTIWNVGKDVPPSRPASTPASKPVSKTAK
jgi:hypothetical protein